MNAGRSTGGATRRDVKSGRSRPALRFPVFPPLPWTILFDEGLRFAITFEEHKIRRTTVGGRAAIRLASFCSTPHCAKHDGSRDFLNKPVINEVEQTHKWAR
jgi:hypothetical protein